MNISNYKPRTRTLNDLLSPEPNHDYYKYLDTQKKRPPEEPIKDTGSRKKQCTTHEAEGRDLDQMIRQLFEGKIKFSDFADECESRFSSREDMFESICKFDRIEDLSIIDLTFYPDLAEHTNRCKTQISFQLLNTITSQAQNLNQLVFNRRSLVQLSRSFSNKSPVQQKTCRSIIQKIEHVWCHEKIPSKLRRNIIQTFSNAKFHYLGR